MHTLLSNHKKVDNILSFRFGEIVGTQNGS